MGFQDLGEYPEIRSLGHVRIFMEDVLPPKNMLRTVLARNFPNLLCMSISLDEPSRLIMSTIAEHAKNLKVLYVFENTALDTNATYHPDIWQPLMNMPSLEQVMMVNFP